MFSLVVGGCAHSVIIVTCWCDQQAVCWQSQRWLYQRYSSKDSSTGSRVPAVQGVTMTTNARHKNIVRRLFEGVINEDRPAVADEFVAPGFINHDDAAGPAGD